MTWPMTISLGPTSTPTCLIRHCAFLESIKCQRPTFLSGAAAIVMVLRSFNVDMMLGKEEDEEREQVEA
jgi:hypothetical protein